MKQKSRETVSSKISIDLGSMQFGPKAGFYSFQSEKSAGNQRRLFNSNRMLAPRVSKVSNIEIPIITKRIRLSYF